jgi:hypothetical protein
MSKYPIGAAVVGAGFIGPIQKETGRDGVTADGGRDQHE